MKRNCGECTLCCTLLPIAEIGKKDGVKCKHQSFAKGCGLHGTPKMPISCRLWNCLWLIDAKTEKLSRPDRSGYVLDISPDYITIEDKTEGLKSHLQIIQVWVDPKRPHSHRDPALRDYLAMLAEKRNIAALIRLNAREAFILFAPHFTQIPGKWAEVKSGMEEVEHSAMDVVTRLRLWGDDITEGAGK